MKGKGKILIKKTAKHHEKITPQHGPTISDLALHYPKTKVYIIGNTDGKVEFNFSEYFSKWNSDLIKKDPKMS